MAEAKSFGPLKGRTAVVTGGASGIGAGLVRRFAREGMNVVAADIEPVALESLTTGLVAEGAKVIGVVTDVSDPSSVDALGREAVKAFGAVHILCNTAGVVVHGPADEQSLDDWKWVLDVNLWGVVNGLRTFVPIMLAQDGPGHVHITSSLGGLVGSSSSSYTASKFAVTGLAEGLRAELAERSGGRIGVSLMCPGGVRTGIFASERNRPAHRSDHGIMSESVRGVVDRLADPNRTDQYTPDEVADQLCQAIADGRFYVLPMQPRYRDLVRAKAEDLLRALAGTT